MLWSKHYQNLWEHSDTDLKEPAKCKELQIPSRFTVIINNLRSISPWKMGAPLLINGTLAITSTCYFKTNFFLTLGLCSVWCCVYGLVSECFRLVFVLLFIIFFLCIFFASWKYLGDIKLINQIKESVGGEKREKQPEMVCVFWKSYCVVKTR